MALPALLAAFRVAATMGGRAAATTAARAKGLQGLTRARSLEGMLKGLMRMPVRAPTGPPPVQPLSAGALPATKQQWMQAAKQFATPNPNAQQVASYVQEHSQPPPAEDSGESGRTTGQLLRTMAGLGGAFGGFKLALKDWTRGIEESAERLRDFNPQIGIATAKMKIDTLRRTYQEASATGQSTAALMQARSNRLDATQPFSNATTNLSNTVKTAVTDLQTRFFGWLDSIGVDDLIVKVDGWIRWVTRQKSREDEAREYQSMFKAFMRTLKTQPESPAPDLGHGGQGGL